MYALLQFLLYLALKCLHQSHLFSIFAKCFLLVLHEEGYTCRVRYVLVCGSCSCRCHFLGKQTSISLTLLLNNNIHSFTNRLYSVLCEGIKKDVIISIKYQIFTCLWIHEIRGIRDALSSEETSGNLII